MRLPDGKKVKLNRFLYGLKPSGYEWFEYNARFMKEIGYRQSEAEPCLWIWREKEGDLETSLLSSGERFHIVCVNVDDDLGFGSDNEIEDRYFKKMCKKFGDVKIKTDNFTYLGMKITHHNNNDIEVSCPAYYDKILLNAGLEKCRPSKTPEAVHRDKDEYMRILGEINWLAI